jgi:hypothetical protein
MTHTAIIDKIKIMEQTQQILKLLSDINNTLDLKNRDDFYSSTTNVQSILNRFYSKESPFFHDLKYVRNEAYTLLDIQCDETPLGVTLVRLKVLYHGILESLIKEIEKLGPPSNNDIKIDQSVNVNVNQNQSQEQVQITELSIFLESIKEDISGKQYKELLAIVRSESNPEIAKPKIIEKLKSFGENVCSNIVANIITNPTIWSGLIQ